MTVNAIEFFEPLFSTPLQHIKSELMNPFACIHDDINMSREEKKSLDAQEALKIRV